MLGSRRRIRHCQRSLFNVLVRARHAPFMLAYVLLPGWHAEEFNESGWVITVPIELPPSSAGSAPRLTKVLHGLEEGLLTVRGDRVFDGHQHGAAVWLGIESQPWLRPINGRLAV